MERDGDGTTWRISGSRDEGSKTEKKKQGSNEEREKHKKGRGGFSGNRFS